MNYHLKVLSRKEYIVSIETIKDEKSRRFANKSLAWWDKNFSWYKQQGCTVLCDVNNTHLSYIFYKVDRYNEYMTIYNLFTPLVERRKGYAEKLLSMIFDLALARKVRRFRLVSISKSLDFYLALGFVYWGMNSVGDYYCDLPIPLKGLTSLKRMVHETDNVLLVGKSLAGIHKRTDNKLSELSLVQLKTYKQDRIKMGKNYMFDKLLLIKKSKG